MTAAIHFQVTVESITRHSEDVATLWLRYVDRRPRYRPGQFIHLAMDPYDPSSHWPDSRVFSIASSPSNTEGMRLTISRQGRFTSRLLDTVEVGQMLWGKGPYGEFEVEPIQDARVALVAGGTGITAFTAFLESALAAARLPVKTCSLFYGARTPDLLAYHHLTDQCATELPGFRVSYYVEEATALGPDRGMDAMVGRLAPRDVVSAMGPQGCDAYYLSGPRAMIQCFSGLLLTDHGVPVERVHVDAWE